VKPQEGTQIGGSEPTYALGVVTRLTGLSAHVLRAWERRYGAVRPIRSQGGTRRYRESDVQRLHLLREAVAAGHPIGEIATSTDADLARRVALRPARTVPALDAILAAIDQLDLAETERLLGTQLAALGAGEFVRGVAVPLLSEIGRRWENGRASVAAEHLASSVVRNLLATALRPRVATLHAAPILFTTLPGDLHESGAMLAAVSAADAGAFAVFVGGNLPVTEIRDAADALGACAVALGVGHANASAQAALEALRLALPGDVPIWIGGAGAADLSTPHGVVRIADFDELARKALLLGERRSPSP
jgi:DNA-binding transcriptional MerR regulator